MVASLLGALLDCLPGISFVGACERKAGLESRAFGKAGIRAFGQWPSARVVNALQTGRVFDLPCVEVQQIGEGVDV